MNVEMTTPSHCWILLLNYCTWEDSLDCIRRLYACDYPSFSIIVVDNNSGNRSLEQLQAALQEDAAFHHRQQAAIEILTVADFYEQPTPRHFVTLLQSPANGGFAAGNNIALRKLQAEQGYVWLLNPDILAEADALTQLVRCAQGNPNSIIGALNKSITGEEVLFYGGGRIRRWMGTIAFIRSKAEIPQLEYISGGCMLIPLTILAEQGLLPETFFLYWEETAWCIRLRHEGVQLQVATEAVVYDKISTSIGRGYLSDYYYTRNGLYIIRQFHWIYLPSAIFFIQLRIIKRLLAGEKKRAQGMWRGMIDYFRGKQYAE